MACCAAPPESQYVDEEDAVEIDSVVKESYRLNLKYKGTTARNAFVARANTVTRMEDIYDVPLEDAAHILGTGMTGYVCVGTNRETGEKVAVKQIFKEEVIRTKGAEMLSLMVKEFDILGALDHPNIVRLLEVYDEPARVNMVMELCSGGDLLDNWTDGGLLADHTVHDVIRILKEMLSALAYTHAKGVVHRDLKLNNWMLESPERESTIKLIDFGLSHQAEAQLSGGAWGDLEMETAVGTLEYGGLRYAHSTARSHLDNTPSVDTADWIACGICCADSPLCAVLCCLLAAAPEMLNGRSQPYNEMCDMWSIGVIAYTLLTDARPFARVTDSGRIEVEATRKRILSGKFYETFLDPYGEKCKDFVRRCLEVDPLKRMTTEEAQSHPFLIDQAQVDQIKRGSSSVFSSMGSAALGQREVTELRRYALSSSFSKGVKIALASRMSRFEIGKIHARFKEIDGNGNGVISLTEFELALGESIPKTEANRVFTALDVGKEGFISYSEFIAGTLQLHHGVTETRLRDAFRQMNKAGEAGIKIADLMVIMGADFTPEEIHNVQLQLDSDMNGYITWNEFSRLIDSRDFFSLARCDSGKDLGKDLNFPISPPGVHDVPMASDSSTSWETLAFLSAHIYCGLFHREDTRRNIDQMLDEARKREYSAVRQKKPIKAEEPGCVCLLS